MEYITVLIIALFTSFMILFIFILNDFYYFDKYKQMAKFNYFITSYYEKYSDTEFNLILNSFYDYLDNENKKNRKEFEKRMKQEFKKNIKNDIQNIY